MTNFAAHPVIIDCDPGHDDALALLLAAGDSRVRLLGVTTVAGNQTLDKTTVIEPSLVRTVAVPVAVELTGTHTRGATVVDLHRRTAHSPNVDVAVGLEVDAFWHLLMAAVRTVGAASGPQERGAG